MKRLDKFKITTNLRNIFYEDKEMQDIMVELYLKKSNLLVSQLVVKKKHMTSVVKDRTRLRRFNLNKHHTPGLIINYLIFYRIHILYFHSLLCYVIMFYLILLCIQLYLVYDVCYD